MTVLEITERAGLKETNLSVAWVKDAIHLIQSSSKQKIKRIINQPSYLTEDTSP